MGNFVFKISTVRMYYGCRSTLMFHGTPVENHCSNITSEVTSSSGGSSVPHEKTFYEHFFLPTTLRTVSVVLHGVLELERATGLPLRVKPNLILILCAKFVSVMISLP